MFKMTPPLNFKCSSIFYSVEIDSYWRIVAKFFIIMYFDNILKVIVKI